MVSLDGTPPRDGPGDFAEAAQELRRVLLSWTNVVPAFAFAEALARLAWGGHIVSASQHDAVCQSYANQLHHASAAADELVRRLHGGDE